MLNSIAVTKINTSVRSDRSVALVPRKPGVVRKSDIGFCREFCIDFNRNINACLCAYITNSLMKWLANWHVLGGKIIPGAGYVS